MPASRRTVSLLERPSPSPSSELASSASTSSLVMSCCDSSLPSAALTSSEARGLVARLSTCTALTQFRRHTHARTQARTRMPLTIRWSGGGVELRGVNDEDAKARPLLSASSSVLGRGLSMAVMNPPTVVIFLRDLARRR